jgi:iron complex outermembrane receptor protein
LVEKKKHINLGTVLMRQTLENDRTFNYAGMFTDALGNTRFYDNETDNYQQDHFQLHWNEKIQLPIGTRVIWLFIIPKEKDIMKNYKENAEIADYGLT